MDKNQLIGFALIFLILIGWSIMTAPTKEEIEAAKEKQRLEELAKNQGQSISEETEKSLVRDLPSTTDDIQSDNSIDNINDVVAEQTSTLSNELMTVAFTNKGGKISYAELNEYKVGMRKRSEQSNAPLVKIFDSAQNKFGYEIDVNGQIVRTNGLTFTPSQSGNKITYTASVNGSKIEQVYTLTDNHYEIGYELKVNGTRQPVKMTVENYLMALEPNDKFEKNYSTVYYKQKDKDSKYCSCTGSDTDEPNNPVEWVAFANQFFSTAFIAANADFENVVVTTDVDVTGKDELKKTSLTADIPMDGGSFDMKMYLGPNEYELLNSYHNELEQVIPFGRSIFGTINRHMIRPFFDFLSGFINIKGVVIIVLIFIIRMALYPLTYRMLKSQAKMQALKPRLSGLKDKLKGDQQKIQMETMKIYREYGVSPVSGCLPMLPQMPIWYALFRFFPASITFRQESFLWASDLSSFDVLFNLPFTIPGLGAHISGFTILWAISQVIYTFYNSRHMDMSANPAMKYVQYAMPLMFFLFFNNYASGLTCYMLFSNIFMIAQTVITKNFIFDDEKILAELDAVKAKPKKKGGFGQKLQEAMERQQKLQAQKEASSKKSKK